VRIARSQLVLRETLYILAKKNSIPFSRCSFNLSRRRPIVPINSILIKNTLHIYYACKYKYIKMFVFILGKYDIGNDSIASERTGSRPSVKINFPFPLKMCNVQIDRNATRCYRCYENR